MNDTLSTPRFVDPVAEGWMGEHIAHYLFGEYRHPRSTAEWCDFFEHLLAAYDATGGRTQLEAVHVEDKNGRVYEQPIVGAAIAAQATPQVRQLVSALIESGKSNGEISAEVERCCGTSLSKTYVSKLRSRLKAVNL